MFIKWDNKLKKYKYKNDIKKIYLQRTSFKAKLKLIIMITIVI